MRKTRQILLAIAILLCFAMMVMAGSYSGTVQRPGLTAAIPTPWPIESDASYATYFANDGEVMLYITNKEDTTATVNIFTAITLGGLNLDEVEFTVPMSAAGWPGTNTAIVGPFPVAWFNVASGTYRGQTKITVAGAVSPNVVVTMMGW